MCPGAIQFDPKIDQALNALGEMARPLTRSAASPSEMIADPRLVDICSAAAKAIFAIIRWEARQPEARSRDGVAVQAARRCLSGSCRPGGPCPVGRSASTTSASADSHRHDA
jgi:hypothetical protein